MLLLLSRNCHSSQEEESTLKPVNDDISHKIYFCFKACNAKQCCFPNLWCRIHIISLVNERQSLTASFAFTLFCLHLQQKTKYSNFHTDVGLGGVGGPQEKEPGTVLPCVFLFFIFVFYKNIFLIWKFTGIYPGRPTAGRPGPDRPAVGRQGHF